MKTLFINIYRDITSTYPNTEVFNAGKDNILDGFYLSLGMAIAEGVAVNEYKPLVVGFAADKPTEFESFQSQWEELKLILLGKDPEGEFDFQLSSEYLEWLKINNSSVYYQKYQGQHHASLKLDIEELYEDTVDAIRRKVLRYLQENDNYKNFDEFVVNDNLVTRRSKLVRAIKDKYEDDLAFVPYEKWLEKKEIPIKEDKEEPRENTPFFIAEQRDKDYKLCFVNLFDKTGKKIMENLERLGKYFYKNEKGFFVILNGDLVKIELLNKEDTVYIEENEFSISSTYIILNSNQCQYIVDKLGNKHFLSEYDAFRYGKKNYVMARRGGLWGIITLDGTILIPCMYHDILTIGTDSNDLFTMQNDNDYNWGVIDICNNIIIEDIYDGPIELFQIGGSDVLFKVSDSTLDYGVVDMNNQIIIPIEYDEIEELQGDFHRYERVEPIAFYIVQKGNEYGIFSSQGDMVMPLCGGYEEDIQSCMEYDYDSDFTNGIIARKSWIDEDPYIYELPRQNCAYDKNGLRIVKGKHNIKLINKLGNTIYTSYAKELFREKKYDYRHFEYYIEQVGEYDEDDTFYRIIGSKGQVLGELPKGWSVGEFSDGLMLSWNTKKEIFVVDYRGNIVKKINESIVYDKILDGKVFFANKLSQIGYYDITNWNKRIIGCCPGIKIIWSVSEVEGSRYWRIGKDFEAIGLFDSCENRFIADCGLYKDFAFLKKDTFGVYYYECENIPFKERIASYEFLEVTNFQNKHGIIDLDGNIIIPIQYDSIQSIDKLLE